MVTPLSPPFPSGALLAPLDAAPVVDAVANLFARTMGAGWFRREAVARYVVRPGAKSEGQQRRFGLVAREPATGEIVGALLAEVIAPDALAGSFLAGYEEVADDPRVAALREGPAAGLITAVAVAERARGRGLATRFVEEGVAGLAARGARVCYAFAWTTVALGCHLGGALERCGFVPVRRFEELYRDFSMRYDCQCPVCGRPCRCAAWLYVRLAADNTT